MTDAVPRSPSGGGPPAHGPAPDTGDELVDALLMAGHRVRIATDQRLRQDGLSLARLKVLRLLEDGPLPMGRVSAVLEVVPRSTTDLVEGMANAGLLERCPHPTDRRVVLVEITPEGRARLEAAQRHASEVAAWATRTVPPAERAHLVALLARVGAPDPGD